MTLKEKFLSFLERFRSSAADQSPSDSDLRRALFDALFATEPGFVDVVDVFQAEGKVVYATAPDGELHLFRRGFTVDGQGAVKLDSATEEVKQRTTFEPISAASAHVCGCGARPSTTALAENKEVPVDRKKRIEALVASGKQCFSAEQLEKFDESALTSLEAHVKAATETPAAVTTPAATPAAATPAAAPVAGEPEKKEPTPEEERAAFLAKNPDLAEMISQHKAAEGKKRTDLVAKLAAAQKAVPKEELEKKSIAELEMLDKVITEAAAPRDFSGRGAPRAAASTDDKPETSEDLRKRQREILTAAQKRSA